MESSIRDPDDLLAALDAACAKLADRDGHELRQRIQRLSEIIALDLAGDPALDLQARVVGELEQLVGALERLVGHATAGMRSAVVDLEPLAAELRAFARYLRVSTDDGQIQLSSLLAQLHGVPPAEESPIDRKLEAVIVAEMAPLELPAAERQRVVARAKRQLAAPARQLALGVQRDAARAQAMAKLERVLDSVAAAGGALGQALVNERAAILDAFGRVDLDQMSGCFGVISTWLSTPTSDIAAHLAVLRSRLAETLGSPSLAVPARDDAARTAAFERALHALVARFMSSH